MATLARPGDILLPTNDPRLCELSIPGLPTSVSHVVPEDGYGTPGLLSQPTLFQPAPDELWSTSNDGHAYGFGLTPSRTVFFAEDCRGRKPEEWVLMGRTLSMFVDISRVGCGCSLSLALTRCTGHTCDESNPVFELFRANNRALHSTTYFSEEKEVHGLGGACWGAAGCAAFEEWQYGPGSSVVDTSSPFRVSVHFEPDRHGDLFALNVSLQGRSGRAIMLPSPNSRSLRRLTSIVKTGLTPIVAYG